ncbi:Myb-related transcription factor, partner of profilin [Anabarilius grahami]|uniref:Myb-related transcription factor, partner of profilin n=1 Tax=Anabarilius grahami TaxID=495550 RepID=A0A3N0YRR9_ANAGA|nr:Myb-related transcription factor, partner of profilin [Anabarilius grahami]
MRDECDPGARQERFTAEETDVLVRAVKDREVVLYGDGRNPPKIASVKQAWEEIATIVSSAGIPRTSHQCRKRYNDIRRRGKSKLASINRACRVTGGGSASTQDLTPAEDIAASTLTAESVEGFGGFEIGTQSETQAVQPQDVFGDEEESMFVKEGDSVTLNSDLTEIKDDDVIQWRFGNTLIAEINKRINRITVYDDVLDGRFRDRLKLDKQTGSLTITDIRDEHAGDYELQINSMEKSFILLIFVKISLLEGDSVTLNSDLTKMKDADVIQWRFRNTLIAEINKLVDRITVYDDVLDGRFRDRLKLDNQTGSLTITNITTEHAGDYELQINSMEKSFILLVFVKISLLEGDSVTLNSDLTKMKDDDVIQWRFRNTLIAEINVTADRITVYDDVLDGRFRDRLKLDNQTGSLTITDIRTEHTGEYKLLTNSVRKFFVLLVFVEISLMEGDSVTLNSDLTGMKDDDVIRWRFWTKNTLVAEIKKGVDRITVYDVLDGRFRDRLKLDNQTGSLTITNITTEHAGDYVLAINGAKPSLKAFRVSVYDSVHCCGPTEAVIRLVLSALVGVATVILLVYDIRSRRAEQQAHIHTSGTSLMI